MKFETPINANIVWVQVDDQELYLVRIKFRYIFTM